MGTFSRAQQIDYGTPFILMRKAMQNYFSPCRSPLLYASDAFYLIY